MSTWTLATPEKENLSSWTLSNNSQLLLMACLHFDTRRRVIGAQTWGGRQRASLLVQSSLLQIACFWNKLHHLSLNRELEETYSVCLTQATSFCFLSSPSISQKTPEFSEGKTYSRKGTWGEARYHGPWAYICSCWVFQECKQGLNCSFPGPLLMIVFTARKYKRQCLPWKRACLLTTVKVVIPPMPCCLPVMQPSAGGGGRITSLNVKSGYCFCHE